MPAARPNAFYDPDPQHLESSAMPPSGTVSAPMDACMATTRVDPPRWSQTRHHLFWKTPFAKRRLQLLHEFLTKAARSLIDDLKG